MRLKRRPESSEQRGPGHNQNQKQTNKLNQYYNKSYDLAILRKVSIHNSSRIVPIMAGGFAEQLGGLQ
jgi:hypothetical protein